MASSGGPFRTGHASVRTSLNVITPQRGILRGPAASRALVGALRRFNQVMGHMHPTERDGHLEADETYTRNLVAGIRNLRLVGVPFTKDATFGRVLAADGFCWTLHSKDRQEVASDNKTFREVHEWARTHDWLRPRQTNQSVEKRLAVRLLNIRRQSAHLTASLKPRF